MITVVSLSRCPVCGCQLKDLAFPSVRVNKRSLRILPGTILRCLAGRCPECGWDLPRMPLDGDLPLGTYLGTVWAPDGRSEAEIAAHRARRWPGQEAT